MEAEPGIHTLFFNKVSNGTIPTVNHYFNKG